MHSLIVKMLVSTLRIILGLHATMRELLRLCVHFTRKLPARNDYIARWPYEGNQLAIRKYHHGLIVFKMRRRNNML